MAEDWAVDVRKYVPDADSGVIAAIERYCGIALHHRDSALVSFTSSDELGRVRDNFLKKKLGLTDPDSVLDQAIASVGDRMKGDRTRNRVTVYYLLAEHFGKLGLFGSAAPAADSTGAVPSAATAAGLAATGLGAAAAMAGTAGNGEATMSGVESRATGAAVAAGAGTDRQAQPEGFIGGPAAGSSAATGSGASWTRWLPWLLLALLAVALLMALKTCKQDDAATLTNVDGAMNGSDSADAVGNSIIAAPAPAIPNGAGVISEVRDTKPALKVYFETGKSDVTKDLAAAAMPLKDYISQHPGTTIAISGFNDPTGSAALNAALSKRRAQQVAAALEGTGIAATSIKLEKPANTTGSGTDNAEERRVEVTIKD